MDEDDHPGRLLEVAAQMPASPFNVSSEMLQFLRSLDLEDLASFAKANEDSTSDDDVELSIFCTIAVITHTPSPDTDLAIFENQAQDFLARTPPGHPDRPRRSGIWEVGRFGLFMARLFRMHPENSEVHPIDRTIDFSRTFGNGLVASHPSSRRQVGFYSTMFDRTGDDEHLDLAINALKTTLSGAPPDDDQLVTLLRKLAELHMIRGERKNDVEDLNESITAWEMVLGLTPSDTGDQRERNQCVKALSACLAGRYAETRQRGDLDRALDAMKAVVEVTPTSSVDYADYQETLNMLRRGRLHSHETDDLDGMIQIGEEWIDAEGDFDTWIMLLGDVSFYYRTRGCRSASVRDLDRAIELADTGLMALAPDSASQAWYNLVESLVDGLHERYVLDARVEDVDRAIQVLTQALSENTNSERRCTFSALLGARFLERYEISSAAEDLDSSLKALTEALSTAPENGDEHRYYLVYANALRARYGRDRDEAYLDLAVDMAEKVIESIPADAPDKDRISSIASNMMYDRFQVRGEEKDISRCVELLKGVITGYSSSGQHRGVIKAYHNYAHALLTRYLSMGSLDDLRLGAEMASFAAERLVNNTNPGNWFDRAYAFGEACSSQLSLATATLSPEALEKATEYGLKALAATESNDPLRATVLSKLSDCSNMKFDIDPKREYLDKAVELGEEAHRLMPTGSSHLLPLADAYDSLFRHTKTEEYRDRYIHLLELSLGAMGPGDRARAETYCRLGFALSTPSTGGDMDRALEAFTNGWRHKNSSHGGRLRCASFAAMIHARRSNWIDASSLLTEAVSLLPLMSPRSLKTRDQFRLLQSYRGLAREATAAALEVSRTAYEALRLLEVGCGITAGLVLEMRTDVADLEIEHPALAQEFLSLRNILDCPVADDELPFPSSQADLLARDTGTRRLNSDRQFTEVIGRIRTLPGFESFLLPPTADQLMGAAVPGPIVVINVGVLRCDAFVIERHQLRSLRLEQLHHEEVESKAKNMKAAGISWQTLEWLWDVAASPILDFLGFDSTPTRRDEWPHIWWISTGAFSHLPIHAAGYHQRGSKETVLDRVVSSYSTSIKALMHSRRSNACRGSLSAESGSGAVKNNSNRALLVAMSNTPGAGALPNAGKEVEMLRGLLRSTSLRPIQINISQKEEILEEMSRCKIFHFAGHGHADKLDPSNSFLLLNDWEAKPMTVEAVRSTWLQENTPFLCYLSACSTTANDEDLLVDEGVHLTSAFQLAGFRHVVGTLWEVSDSCCVDVARVFYETLVDLGFHDEIVAWGLHNAVRALRDRRTGDGATRRSAPVGVEAGVGEGLTQDCKEEDEGTRADDDRADRNAELIDDSPSDFLDLAPPRLWAPYIHVG